MNKVQISLIFSLFFIFASAQGSNWRQFNLTDRSKQTSEQLDEIRPIFFNAHKNNDLQQQCCCFRMTLLAVAAFALGIPFLAPAFTSLACQAQCACYCADKENHYLDLVRTYVVQNFSRADIAEYLYVLKKDDRSLKRDTMYYNLMYSNPICCENGQFYYHDFLKSIKDAAPSRQSMA